MTKKHDKAAMWLRVSTDDQDLASQRRALMNLASARGYETSDRITYELKGVSAWKGKHSVYLEDTLADARAGRFKYLLIWAFDRLSREGSEQALRIVREFEEAGVTVVSHQEPYIESTSEDREVMIAIAGSTARRESNRRSSRMMLSNEQRRSQGKVTNRSPYGYRGDTKTGLRLIDEPSANIVRIMFDMYDATRMSIRGIQKLLNDRYSPPLGEGKKKNNKKVVWSNETIRRILRRKIYTGGVDAFDVDTPQLVTCEQFERVQTRLSANYRRKPATKRVLPLQGRMTCVCGGHVHYDAATQGKGNDYYRCRNVYSHSYHVMKGGMPCGIKSQLAQRVHQRLRDELADISNNPEKLITILNVQIAERKAMIDAGVPDPERLRVTRANLEESLRLIERSRIKQILPPEELDEMEADIKDQIAQIDADLRDANPEELVKLEKAKGLLQGLRDLKRVAAARVTYTKDHPEQPMHFGVFSFNPDFAESNELIELRNSGMWPGKFASNIDPDVQLERTLDALHAEVVLGEDTAKVSGLFDLDVSIPVDDAEDSEPVSLHASPSGRGLG
jgi:DNA invertase Pin-like site-specific DNA recombinase